MSVANHPNDTHQKHYKDFNKGQFRLLIKTRNDLHARYLKEIEIFERAFEAVPELKAMVANHYGYDLRCIKDYESELKFLNDWLERAPE